MKVPDIQFKQKSKKCEESEIITGSPYKENLIVEQEKSKKTPKDKKNNSTGKKKAASSKGKEKKPKKITQTVENEDWECFVCGEWWSNSPPGDVWVQWSVCSSWIHEICSTMLGTVMCDLCSV